MNEAESLDSTAAPTIHRRRLFWAGTTLLAGVTGVAAPVLAEGKDAELIVLCDQLVRLHADFCRLTAACQTIEQEQKFDPHIDAVLEEQERIWHRLAQLDDPKTLAGATAMARASHALWEREIGGTMRAPFLAEWLAVGVLEFHAGRGQS